MANSAQYVSCLLVFAACTPFQLSHAQPSAPGRVEQDTRPVPEPAVRPPILIERPLFPEQAPVGADKAVFTLGAVQIVGNATIPTDSLASLWADKISKQVSLAEAFGWAAAISARYREAGFVLSQAAMPVQTLSTTTPVTLRIDVLEGYVDQVTYTGIDGSKLEGYLAPVLAERPLRLATLERSLLLVGELAGVTAQANIRQGLAPNSSHLEVLVARSPSDFSVSVHNRSAPSQGRVRLEASASLRGIVADFDRHDLRLISSGDKRLNLLSYGLEAPVGGNGLKAQLNASASRSEPTSQVGNLDTRSDNLSVGLTYPVLRSRQSSLGLRSTLGGYNNSSDTSAGRVSQDNIRALRIGLTADYADDFGGISLIDVEGSKGLSGLGASKAGDPMLLDANPSFSKLTLYAARLQNLGGSWSLLVAVTGQASGSKLPSAEQIGLGGDTFLRAYDPSEVIGENGSAGKVELRFNQAFGAVSTTFYVYGDSGQVRRKQTGADDQISSLSAAGAGVRFSGPYRSKGYLEVAKPVHRVVASQGNTHPRVFAGIGIDF